MDQAVELVQDVRETLCSYTRLQSLCAATLGLERMWQVFLDWTNTKQAPYLLRPPEQYREPFRQAIDLLWEQVTKEQIYNAHQDVFDELAHFEQSSYDEEDALDVDYGYVKWFIDALISAGINAFFPVSPERKDRFPWNDPQYYEKKAASLITVYAATLYGFLYNAYAEKTSKTEDEIDAMVAKDSLWLEEIDRIRADLLLVRDYPDNKETVLQQAAIYRSLRTKPFCPD